MLLFLALFLFPSADSQTTTTTAAPTISPYGQRCASATYSTDYNLPLGVMTPGQTCILTFNIPTGQMAFLDLISANMSYSFERPAISEIVVIDVLGNTMKNIPDLVLSIAFPTNFTIYLKIAANETAMSLGINVQFKPNQLNVKTLALNTATNGPSKVYWMSQLKEGNTYVATSTTKTGVSVAIAKLTEHHAGMFDFMNIFVYDNGVLKGTLNSLGNFPANYSSKIQLYVARASTQIYRGAFLVTDTSNLPPTPCYQAAYVPTDVGEHHFPLEDCNGQWGALSIIGDPDGSTPYDVTKVDVSGVGFGSNMTVTQYVGGPVPNAQGEVLNDSNTPEEVIDILTTFNVKAGWGAIWITFDPNK